MPDSKITALTSISTSTDPANDPLVIVDVSDTSMAATGTTKKVTLNQLLGASGTATLASATITGDLTVDTNTLKVDSANNRVIVGHTSGSSAFQVTNAGAAGIEIQPTGFSSAPLILSYNRSAPAYTQLTLDGSTIVHALSGTTAMTLNSTGLGVGVSPSYNLDVRAAAAVANVQSSTGTNAVSIVARNTGGSFTVGKENSVGGGSGVFGQDAYASVLWSTGAYPIAFGTNGAQRMLIDSTGNVGIGVTPSVSKLHVGITSTATSGLAEANALKIENNNATVNNAAGLFLSQTGDAGCGIAGIATSRTGGSRTSALALYYYNQATSASPIEGARLDASGNLLVAATSTSLTTGTGLKILQNSGVTTVGTVGSSSSDVDTTYRLYSSTASAYRFYVGYGGTVYATNTTISAISDARLKENVQDIDVGLGAILALKPRKFDWKAGKGKDIKGDRGFIAQEFEQVFPQLVDQWADEAPEGEAPYKSVRQDLIPVLVKAIQELTAEVNALKNT